MSHTKLDISFVGSGVKDIRDDCLNKLKILLPLLRTLEVKIDNSSSKDTNTLDVYQGQLDLIRRIFENSTDADLTFSVVSPNNSVDFKKWQMRQRMNMISVKKKMEFFQQDLPIQSLIEKLRHSHLQLGMAIEYLEDGKLPDLQLLSRQFSPSHPRKLNTARGERSNSISSTHSRSTLPIITSSSESSPLNHARSSSCKPTLEIRPQLTKKRSGSFSNLFAAIKLSKSECPALLTLAVKQGLKGNFSGYNWKKRYMILNDEQVELYRDERDAALVDTIITSEIQDMRIEKTKSNETYLLIKYQDKDKLFMIEADEKFLTEILMLRIDLIRRHVGYPILSDTTIESLLCNLYFTEYKGGMIKSSYQEEWCYYPNGELKCLEYAKDENPTHIDLFFKWNGHELVGIEDSQSLGFGIWNSDTLEWRGVGELEEISYHFDHKTRVYTGMINNKESQWQWTRHFLANKLGRGEWIVEGQVPEPIIMFLQIIRYIRRLYDKSD